MTHKTEFQSSGTSPTPGNGPDFLVENQGTIFLLQTLSPAANTWIEHNLPEDRLVFGGAVCVEHRYIADIVDGILEDGLAVSR
jgi:hypothetical protein